MISETDIVGGYLWLLGRVPSGEEIENCRARFRDSGLGEDTVRVLQSELLSSEEFRNRRLLMNRMRHNARPDLEGERLAFVHIEKCAGTTMHEMLRTQFAEGEVCPERHSSLGDWTLNELAGFRLFSGHFDLAYCRSIPGRVRVATLLREPRARLFSLYRFWKAHRPHPDRDLYDLIRLARQHDAESFFALERVRQHPALRDAIAGQLTRTSSVWALQPGSRLIDDPEGVLAEATASLEAMATFGIVERFEDSRALFNRMLGLDMRAVAPRQVLAEMLRGNEELVALPPEPITPRLSALLDALTTIDRPLYARALSLFERRVSAMNGCDLPAVIPARRQRRRALQIGWRRRAAG